METHMMTRKTGLVLATLTGALLAMACGGTGYGTTAPPQTDNTVAATPSLTFTPGTLPVNVGETVTFAFGSVPHNVFFTQQAGAPAEIGATTRTWRSRERSRRPARTRIPATSTPRCRAP